MSDIDVQGEWRRLQDLYAGLSEDELEAVAERGYELTDVAKQVLNAEISRRGLNVNMRLAPPAPKEPEPDRDDKDFNPADYDLKGISYVETREEADWVKTTLNDAGIACFFGPDLVDDLDRLPFAPEHGFSVNVLKHDVDRARFVLRGFDEAFGKEPAEEGDLVVRCPKCGSSEVLLQSVDETGKQALFNWSCDACSHEWQDDGNEAR